MTDCAISNNDLQYKYLHKISMIYCYYLDLYYLHFAVIVQLKVCCFSSFVVYLLIWCNIFNLIGSPTWGRLYRLATEATASLALRTIKLAVCNKGQNSKKTNIVEKLRSYLGSELPTTILRDVLDVSLAQDRFRCHHNPTECVALELW